MAEQPTRAKVVKLERPAQQPKRTGRPPKLEMPPIPEEILDGYSELERQHFQFILEALRRDYGIHKPSDEVALLAAAFEYIEFLRVKATSAQTGEVITAARQHPGVQFRAWLDLLGATRKQRKDQPQDPEKDAWMEAMTKLSS